MISTVQNETLHFVEIVPEFKVIQSIPLNVFMDQDAESDIKNAIAGIQHYTNALFIIPNYWVGNALYQFQSSKRSFIEAFLSRKLRTDFSGHDDIVKFFNYKFTEGEKKSRSLYVYFLQDAVAFKVYERLKQWGAEPIKMTTPSFILENKVANSINTFNQGGKCLIHMLSNECFVYFYYQGNFLFDRIIALPKISHMAADNPDKNVIKPQNISMQDITNIVTYEINQSLFLFSQKTKSDIDMFFLLSTSDDEIERLTKALDRDIENLNKIFFHKPDPNLENTIGALASFTAEDIIPSQTYLTISNKELENTIKWKPVKYAGAIIGIFLFLILALENFFILEWSRINDIDNFRPDPESKQVLADYNQVLDILIREKEQPKPKQIIEKLIMSLPDNIILNEIIIQFEKNPNLNFNGTMLVKSTDQVRNTLSQLVSGLNKYLAISRPITLENIDFKKVPQQLPDEDESYLMTFNIDLK